MAGRELIADFQQYTNYNLADVLVDGSGLTPRLALILAQQLPIESRTMAALRGGMDFWGWGPDRYLLAAIYDNISQNNYINAAAASGKKKPPKPKPIDRPEVKKARKQSPNAFANIAALKLKKAKEAKKAVKDG